MARFGSKEVANISLYNLKTKEPELFLDSLKMTNLENTAEEAFAVGGMGANQLMGWDFGRKAVMNIQDALLNPKAISMQLGTELKKGVEEVFMREVLIGNTGTAGVDVTLAFAPVAGSLKLIKSEDGYGHDEKILPADIALVGKVATVDEVVLEDGEQVIAYYKRLTTVEAEVITIDSNKFGGYYMVVGDTFWRNEISGEDEMVQIVIGKAKISSNFNFTMQPDGEPSVFDFNLTIFKEPNKTEMVRIVRYQ